MNSHARPPRRLTLCADDFAQTDATSGAILALLGAGRLSATSVMSQSPLWPEHARALKAFDGQADIGLHFNLTHPFEHGTRPLPYWLLLGQLRALSRARLQDLALAQIDRFAEHFGRLPDFIDGHQHVHAFPVIREALLAAIEQRWEYIAPPYLRAPDRLAHPGDSGLKARVLASACRGFQQRAKAQGLRTPPWFAGLYALTPEADFPGLMQAWLDACPDRGLLMCHPGHGPRAADDPIADAREREYAFLASDAFMEACAQRDILLTRFG